jgi:tRNA 2-thiouridine synthesizing protein A
VDAPLDHVRLDLRGLPAPQPLVRSLEAVSDLRGGESLVIVTERRPAHLLPLLHERGFDIDPLPLGDRFEILVRRPLYA